MNRGRQNGKRHAKRKAPRGAVVTRTDRVASPTQLTGTLRTVLDNTVPGGVRYEHTPGTPPRDVGTGGQHAARE